MNEIQSVTLEQQKIRDDQKPDDDQNKKLGEYLREKYKPVVEDIKEQVGEAIDKLISEAVENDFLLEQAQKAVVDLGAQVRALKAQNQTLAIVNSDLRAKLEAADTSIMLNLDEINELNLALAEARGVNEVKA
jgi:citrate lyase gamma subunit